MTGRAHRSLVALAVLAAVVAGCGDARQVAAPAPLGPADSSWTPGQASLATLSGYGALLGRASAIAQVREAARQHELARIEAAKRAARLKARKDALRKYLEAKRRAERLYKEALRKAALERKRQQEKLRKARLERARKLRELMKKLRVKPGEECKLPEVREQFHCESGRLPFKGSLRP